MGGGSPLVDYGIASQKRPKLLMAVSAAFGGLSGVGGTCVGVPPTLADEIRWESQVDEADIVDWTVAVSSGVLAGLIDAFYVGDFPSILQASGARTHHLRGLRNAHRQALWFGAVLLEQHEEWQYGERRYLSDISMRRLTTLLRHDPEPTALTAA